LYQAILPLPYFHIGSESIWIEQECDIMKWSFIVSMKTGLPNIGMMAARTSLSQTYKNIEFVRTPWKKYRVLDQYKNNRAILLTVANCDRLTNDEKRLIENAIVVGEFQQLKLYRLPFDVFKNIPAKYNYPDKYRVVIDSLNRNEAIEGLHGYVNFTGNMEGQNRTITIKHDFQNIVEGAVKLDMAKPFYLRFWVKDFDQDLVARTQLVVFQSTPDHKTLEEKYSDIFRNIRAINEDWALIEIKLMPKQEDEIIKLLIKNNELEGEQLYFDEFSVSQSEF
jgi:hypothetical protein